MKRQRPKRQRKNKAPGPQPKYKVGDTFHGDPPLPRGKWKLLRAGNRGDTDWKKIGEAK